MTVQVTGLDVAITAMRKQGLIYAKAHAAALRKTAVAIRGQLRRSISGRTGTPLKLTRKRVAWFWSKRRSTVLTPAEIKMWFGTKWRIGPAELPRLDRAPKGEREIDLYPHAARLVNPIASANMRKRYPREVRSQMRRFQK